MERLLKILLVEDEQNVCQKLKTEIDKDQKNMILIGITNSSYHAIELVHEYTPNVVILDLELHFGEGSGFHFLKQLKNLHLSVFPYILVVTNNSSPTTYQIARKLGADFIMYKHQENYSETKIIEFLEITRSIIQSNQRASNLLYATDETLAQRNQHLRCIISRELNYIGINPKSVGFLYLTEAIFIALEDIHPNIAMVIAQKHEKTHTSVERGMQNAINRAWRTSDINTLFTHYTAKINSTKGVPTFTEFIRYYANKIRNEH